MPTRNVFHFPDGRTNDWLNLSYCHAQFNIGEKIIIEDDPRIFTIVDIQNQFRQMPPNSAGTELKMMMRNIILKETDISCQ